MSPRTGVGWLDLLRLAVEGRRADRTRTLLAVGGIAVGIFGLSLIGSVAAGLDSEVTQIVGRKLGGRVVLVRREPSELRTWEEWKRFRSRPPFTAAQQVDLRRRLGGAAEVAAAGSRRATVRHRQRTLDEVEVRGWSCGMPEMVARPVATGRWFHAADDRRGGRVCVLGSDAAAALFPDRDPLGERLTLLGARYTVIGVAEAEGDILGASQDRWVVLPLEEWLARVGRKASLTAFVRPSSGATLAADRDEVRQAVRQVRGLAPGEADDFTLETAEDFLAAWSGLSRGARGVVTAVAAVAVLVGGLLISNVLLLDVVKRRLEMGVRRSVGARRRDVLRQVLVEALGLTLTGGLVGILAAALAALALARTVLPIAFDAGVVALGLGASAAVGLAAGMLPAWRAVRIEPIEAMRRGEK